jgi:hypothetical protein
VVVAFRALLNTGLVHHNKLLTKNAKIEGAWVIMDKLDMWKGQKVVLLAQV